MESTVIDLRDGDDVFHGDPEYKFLGIDSEWGIDPGDLEQNGTLGFLDIRGGDGNDQLFGGALADIIDGGDGIDFISGGEGDDTLIGGPGSDLIAGNTIVAPDSLEFVTRGGDSGLNDDFTLASILEVQADFAFDASLSEAESGDWYLVKTPQALNAFGETETALLSTEMITTTVLQDVGGVLEDTNDSLEFFLFAAQNNGDDENLEVVPVERFSGVPEFYLLHVTNTLVPDEFFALELDGAINNYVSSANPFIVNPPGADLVATEELTIEALIRPDDVGTSAQRILDKSGEYSLTVEIGGTITAAFAQGDNASVHSFTTTGTVSASEWTHVAATYDPIAASTVRITIYINGVAESTDVDTSGAGNNLIGDLDSASNLLTIGSGSTGTTFNYDGLLDEVRVWQTVRTVDEIRANDTLELEGTEAGLAAYWTFNQVVGNSDGLGDVSVRATFPDSDDLVLNGSAAIISNFGIDGEDDGGGGDDNPEVGETGLLQPFGAGEYRLDFNGEVGVFTDVSPESAEVVLDSSVLADSAKFVSLGDINGDGLDDIIASVETTPHTVTVPDENGNPVDVDRYSARIHFGGTDTVIDADSPRLELPAPLFEPDANGALSVISSPGDLDGDGVDDIVVAVTHVAGFSAPDDAGVYILFGINQDLPADIGDLGLSLDVVRDRDIAIGGFTDPVLVGNGGDLNADGISDLVIVEQVDAGDDVAYVFEGRDRTAWVDASSAVSFRFDDQAEFDAFVDTNSNSSIQSATGANLFHFADPADGRNPDNPANLNAGVSDSGSIYFGTGEGPLIQGNYDVGVVQGRIESKSIGLTGELTLSFNYLMDVESGATYDRALVQVDAGAGFQTVADNFSLNNLTRDTNGQWASFSVDISSAIGGDQPDQDTVANFTTVGSALFFSADDGNGDTSLWKLSGSSAVKMTLTGAEADANPTQPVESGGALFFVADTATGTTLFRLANGATTATVVDATLSGLTELTDVEGRLFFVASDETDGTELRYVKDDFSVGTLDLDSGTDDSNPSQLTSVGVADLLYMVANDGSGETLHKVRLTNQATATFSTFEFAVSSIQADSLAFVDGAGNGTLYLVADDGVHGDELLQFTDAQNTSTTGLSDPAAVPYIELSAANDAASFGASSVFSANGTEVWRLDATGLTQLTGFTGTPGNFTGSNNEVYFTANNDVWRATGGALTQVNGAVGGSAASEVTVVNGNLFFEQGGQLWRGTDTTVTEVLDAGASFMSVNSIVAVSTTEVFVIGETDAGNDELFRIPTGSNAATAVTGFSGLPTAIVATDSAATFTAGGNVYRVDAGSTTAAAVDFTSQAGDLTQQAAVVDGTTFFTRGSEIWKTDGSADGSGTVQITGFGTSADFTTISQFTVVDDGVAERLYFSMDPTGGTGTQLYTLVADDTTVAVADAIAIDDLTVVGSTLFYTTGSGASLKFIDTDGTDTPTTVASLPGGTYSELAARSNELFFLADAGDLITRDVFEVAENGTLNATERLDSSSTTVAALADTVRTVGTNVFITATTVEHQQFSIEATAGTYNLDSSGTNSGVLNFNATDAQVEAALAALFSDVVVERTVASDLRTYDLFFYGETGDLANLTVEDIDLTPSGSGITQPTETQKGGQTELWTSTGGVAVQMGGLFTVTPAEVVAADNEIYYRTAGNTVYRVSSTGAETEIKAAGASAVSQMVVQGDHLYYRVGTTQLFQVQDADTTPDLVTTTGTVDNLTVSGVALFFTDGGTLRRIENSAPETAVEVLDDGSVSFAGSITSFAELVNGDDLWFSEGTSNELWSVDDNAGGATITSTAINEQVQLAGIVDEAADADTALDKKTFFTLTNGELWQFDHGDALGLELTGSFADDDASQLTAVGNNLFFVADDAVSGTQNRLWQINASGAFTEITGALPATSIGELTEAGGDLFYVVDGDTLRKQVSGGTTTTTLVNDNNAISMLTEVNGEIQFRHNDGHSIEVWTANGTAEPVMDGSAPIIDNHDDLTAVGAANAQVLYFTATDNANGNELWEIDGSGRLKAVNVNTTGNSSPAELLDIGGELFFVATDDGTRRNVFNYDGTTVTDLTGNFFTIADGPQSLTESNGILFFSAAEDDTASGRELWKIVSPTGTPVLTEIEIDTRATGSAPQNLVDVSNTLFFSANDGSGAEIWSSDGGAVGAGTDPAFSGPGSVVVAFDFASFDGVLNAGEGWYIDDILIGSDLELSDADNVIDLGVEIISVAGLGDFDGADATPIDDLGLLTDAADELQVISGDASLAASITSGDVTVDIAGGAGVTANHKLSAAGDVDGDGTTDALISGPDITDDTWLVHNKGDTQLRGTGALMTALGDVDGDGRSDLGLVSTETSPTIGEDGELLEHQVGHLFLGRDIGDLTEILNLGTFGDPDLVIEPEQPDYVSVGGSFVRPLVFEGVGDVGVSPLSGVTVFGDLTGTGVAGQALIAASGTVEVLVAFPASASDTDTTYTISLQGGGVLREAHVNQRLAPAGKIVGSTHYHSLGTVSLPAGGVLEVKTDGAILNTGGALDAQDVVVVSHNADFGLAEAFGSQVNVFLGHPIVANPLVTETEETPEAYIFDLAPPFISPTFNTGVDGLILPGTHQQVSIDTEPTIAAGSVSGPVDTEVELFTAGLSGELSSLDVRIRLDSATATSDNLSATLTSPSGIVVTLFSDIDASAGLDVTFTDDSGRLIADAVAGEFVGTLRPEQSLSDFVGENPDGVWILTFSNDDRDQGAVLAEAALGISVVSDLTALDPDALNALEAPALEGERAGDELSAVQNIGDFSGDGVDDLLVSGNGAHYVIFGPLNLDDIGDVEKFADLVIDAAAVGDPADLMGNINGDTYNDLVFVRHDVSSNDSFVTVFFGGVSDAVEAVVSTNGDRNRLLTSADADRAFTVDLDNLVTGSLDTGFSTAVLNYDGITDVGYQDSLSVTDPTPTLNTALTGAGVDFQFGDAILSGVLIGQDATNPVPVTSDGVLTITARLDLAAAPNEFLTIDAEGVFSTVLFKNDGKQGGVVTDTIEISKEDLLQLADDGNITFTVTAGNQVNHLWFTDFLSLELTYNEVERDDLLVMSDSGGYVISGADITNGKWDPLDDLTNFEAGDAFNADGDEFTTRIIVSNGSADIQTTVAGDLNGDGLDDTLFTDRDTGAVHLLLGETPSSAARTLDFDNRVFRGDDIQSTVGLGDLNRDGYDEFAALRSVEDGVSSEGGVLVFFGSETLTVGENIIEPDDFSNGTVLNEVSTLVTFSQVGSDGETSTGDAIAQNSTFTDSNGGTNRVIGSTNLGTAGWVDTGTRFRGRLCDRSVSGEHRGRQRRLLRRITPARLRRRRQLAGERYCRRLGRRQLAEPDHHPRRRGHRVRALRGHRRPLLTTRRFPLPPRHQSGPRHSPGGTGGPRHGSLGRIGPVGHRR